MKLYTIKNWGRSPRAIHDGVPGQQKRIRIGPGDNIGPVELDDKVAEALKHPDGLFATLVSNDGVVEEWPKPRPVKKKPAIIIDGMYGIGDNLHERAPIRALMETHEVWLKTCMFNLWLDLIGQGLHLIFKDTKLSAQSDIIKVERDLWAKASFPPPPPEAHQIKLWYHKRQIDIYGPIARVMMHECGVGDKPIDFSIPVQPAWRDAARKLIASWDTGGKPIMIYRPIVRRNDWNGMSRNPDPAAYKALYAEARKGYFVVSLARLIPNVEWIVGTKEEFDAQDEDDVDVKIHDGSVSVETQIALFREANCIFCNAGYAPVMAQAVGTPSIVVYGGRESFKTTQAAGEHLAPTLPIDPDNPCDCHSSSHNCDKTITLPPALKRVREFADKYLVQKPRVLLFATTYIDCPERVELTEFWLEIARTLNPDCDVLIVDSASPTKVPGLAHFKPYVKGERHREMLHDFGDNVGHLSRKGRDGWGRAFTFGLQAAVDCGYDFAVHIEGDSLFRLPVMDIVKDMRDQGVKAASIPVLGMTRVMPNWVETGLMFFSCKYLKESDLANRYDWPNRQQSPTPEVVLNDLIGKNLKIMPWKGLRGDKNQITNRNVLGLGLDWVTHCHNDTWCYRMFMDATLGRDTLQVVAPQAAAPERVQARGPVLTPAPTSQAHGSGVVKLNLGCGDNKLRGWINHDAEIDISKPLPWADNSVDFIFCEHCVEHVTHFKAIDFFIECHRVLKPGGVVRITVPSIEQIYRGSSQDYWEFATKFHDRGPTLRGALHNIIFKHGHEMIWTRALMECCLYYAGFDYPKHCETHQSDHPELQNVEGHHRVIGHAANFVESMAFECVKAGARVAAMPPPDEVSLQAAMPTAWPPSALPEGRPAVAIVVGGGGHVWEEINKAIALCEGVGAAYEFFVVNDMIEQFPRDCSAVTLHPNKLSAWLTGRAKAKYPRPTTVFAHVKAEHVDVAVDDWGGSSGLLAVKVALTLKHQRILLCGVPMSAGGGHFVRKRDWIEVKAYLRSWDTYKGKIVPFVRSFSGLTAEMFGKPDRTFLQ